MQRKRQRTSYVDWYNDNQDDDSDDDDEEYAPEDRKDLDPFPTLSSFSVSSTKSQQSGKIFDANLVPISPEYWESSESKVALSLIGHQLDLTSIATCSRVCKLWHTCLSQPIFWNVEYQKYFGKSTQETEWKQEFKNQYKNTREVCMYGGNLSRSFTFFSDSESTFSPPQVCKTFLSISDDVHQELDLCNVFLYHNKFILAYSKSIQAYDLNTSSCLWNTALSLDEAFDGLVADEDAIYCKTRFGDILSADMSTGSILWQHTVPELNDDADQIQDLVIYGDELLYLNEKGWLISRSCQNGNELYKVETSIRSAHFTSSIIIHNSFIYWTVSSSPNNYTYLFVAKDRQLLVESQLDIQSSNNLTIDEYGNPFIIHAVEGEFFMKAFQLDMEKQVTKVLWDFEYQKQCNDRPISKSAYYCRGIVWSILCNESSIIGLDAKTGSVVHTVRFAPTADPTTYIAEFDMRALPLYSVNGILYFAVYNNVEFACTYYLGAIELATGKHIWNTKFKSAFEADWRSEYQMAVHPNVKMILGQTEKCLLLLCHN